MRPILAMHKNHLLVISAIVIFNEGRHSETEPVANANWLDIGRFSLFANIQGDDSPAVLFESGGGNSGNVWRLVQPEIAEISTNLSYDRAGIGKSDTSFSPGTAGEQVKNLATCN